MGTQEEDKWDPLQQLNCPPPNGTGVSLVSFIQHKYLHTGHNGRVSSRGPQDQGLLCRHLHWPWCLSYSQRIRWSSK